METRVPGKLCHSRVLGAELSQNCSRNRTRLAVRFASDLTARKTGNGLLQSMAPSFEFDAGFWNRHGGKNVSLQVAGRLQLVGFRPGGISRLVIFQRQFLRLAGAVII